MKQYKIMLHCAQTWIVFWAEQNVKHRDIDEMIIQVVPALRLFNVCSVKSLDKENNFLD